MPRPKPTRPQYPPPRPRDPIDGYVRRGDTFTVPGVAVVTAAPHRNPREAKQLALRIAADARSYLPVLVGLNVPGVVDLRPRSHAKPAFPRPANGHSGH